VAIKKVTNVFSKKILAKRALREIKLLQHFRGKSTVHPSPVIRLTPARSPQRKMQPLTKCNPHDTMLNSVAQITCLYDMDIPRPDNFNECYLYEGADYVSCIR
jgi:ATP-dependent RNA helicase DDX18/HAS1